MSDTIDLPDFEPKQFALGETVEFEIDLCDFPADEWTLTYYFRGPAAGIDVVATTDGTTFLITIPSTQTDDLTIGNYYWQAWATKGSEKHKVREGTVEVVAGFDVLTTATLYDARTTAKKILDAIDAIMAGKATADQQEYTIGAAGAQRQLKRLLLSELIAARKYYAGIVRAENRRRQNKSFRTIRIQFDKP